LQFSSEEQFAINCARQQAHELVNKLAETVPVMEDAEGRKFIFAVGIHPPVAHPVLLKRPEAEYAMVWHPARNSVSLYSLDDGPDVSLIAKEHGGGGHIHAAGFPTQMKAYEAIVNALVKK
jgi:hypothetical protein